MPMAIVERKGRLSGECILIDFLATEKNHTELRAHTMPRLSKVNRGLALLCMHMQSLVPQRF